MPDNPALTINCKHLDLHLRGHHAASEIQGMAADLITEANPAALAMVSAC